MTKKPLNLLVDEDLVKKARNHGLVISRFLENKLEEYFSFIDAVSKTSSPYIGQKHNLKTVNEKSNNYHQHSKPQSSKSGAYGLVVMTSPSHGGGRRFKSG